MLTFEQIKELIELVASHRMSGLELERSGFRLQIDGYQAAEAVQVVAAPQAGQASALPAAPAAAAPVAAAPAAVEPEPNAEGELPEDAHVIKSPIVGTFYRSPNPEAPAFAEVGDSVKKGQVLCIVEAMKLMNEIDSDLSGVVLAVFPENGQPVEYGEPLFAIQERPV